MFSMPGACQSPRACQKLGVPTKTLENSQAAKLQHKRNAAVKMQHMLDLRTSDATIFMMAAIDVLCLGASQYSKPQGLTGSGCLIV